jgi:hypothetical protein
LVGIISYHHYFITLKALADKAAKEEKDPANSRLGHESADFWK